MSTPVDLVQTLCDLVRIPSVNPMDRPCDGDEFFEHRMTDHLQSLFEQWGLAWHRQPIAPKRENIVARLDGDPTTDRLLVFEAHQDTVPVDGMTIAPWQPEVTDGRVTGRGACDIKGGMACMLTALARLSAERPAGMPTVIMACSVNEEHGFSGAAEMAESWRDGTHPLVPRVPDEVIVAEPTELNVVVAHKGVVRWNCVTHGRAAHSSRPQLGQNAIYRMGHILTHLETYASTVVGSLGSHPLVGRPTLNVGLISGGISVNTVPDRCAIQIDRRLLPAEEAEPARRHVLDFLADQLDDLTVVEHEPPFICAGGLDDSQNTELAARLGAVAGEFGGGQRIGVPFGTDAPAFAGIGAPTVVFGPGSVDQAHTCDEWVAIEQLERASDIYYRFARGG